MAVLGDYEQLATQLRNQIAKMHLDIELAENALAYVRKQIANNPLK